jgi:hypothetical protein
MGKPRLLDDADRVICTLSESFSPSAFTGLTGGSGFWIPHNSTHIFTRRVFTHCVTGMLFMVFVMNELS